jgi:PAS domain S-box-containing protein
VVGEYALWILLASLLMGGATWGLLLVWNRALRQEAEQAERLAAARETELRTRAEAQRSAAAALLASERRHRALTEAGAIVIWRAGADGRIAALEGWEAFTGQDPTEVMGSAEAWLGVVTPEDRGRAFGEWVRAVATRSAFDLEFRVRVADGGVRWCRARAVPVPLGEPLPGGVQAPGAGEWIGVMEDIDTRRRAEEARLLLAREVNHRAKNMLAVVQAVVQLTRPDDPRAFAASISARIAALGRAHDLLAGRDWGDVAFAELARGELAPYLIAAGGAKGEARVRLSGPDVRLAAAAVQPIAVALHELSVNAAKYGALSPGHAGRVELSWDLLPAGAGLRISWAETGGPALEAPPKRRGFGTRVVDASVGDQLGGTVERHWRPEGLLCEITLPAGRLGGAPAEQQPAERV